MSPPGTNLRCGAGRRRHHSLSRVHGRDKRGKSCKGGVGRGGVGGWGSNQHLPKRCNKASNTDSTRQNPINSMWVVIFAGFMLHSFNDRCQYECVMLPCPAHPLLAEHTGSMMHKHFNTVLKRPLHAEAPCLTSLAVITTGPFIPNWHAHSLVTPLGAHSQTGPSPCTIPTGRPWSGAVLVRGDVPYSLTPHCAQ